MRPIRKPAWLSRRIDFDKGRRTSSILRGLRLNTVCREALCPNISECFGRKHATFLILGRACTRRCRFCHVEKSQPAIVDGDEPRRVAQAVDKMGLRHAVITSVTRDDLPDGGASMFSETVAEIKNISRRSGKKITVELLIPDFRGDPQAVRCVAESRPEIIGHNIETVPRLYRLRPRADYRRSLEVLARVKNAGKDIYTKSALMLGLGERQQEVLGVMEDLRKVGCDFLALGQYLRPGLGNAPVAEYVPPQKFERYKTEALALGFRHVESRPYARSSYRAADYLKDPGRCQDHRQDGDGDQQ